MCIVSVRFVLVSRVLSCSVRSNVHMIHQICLIIRRDSGPCVLCTRPSPRLRTHSIHGRNYSVVFIQNRVGASCMFDCVAHGLVCIDAHIQWFCNCVFSLVLWWLHYKGSVLYGVSCVLISDAILRWCRRRLLSHIMALCFPFVKLHGCL